MKVINFSPSIKTNTDKELYRVCSNFETLLSKLRKKELDEDLVKSINHEIELLNSISESATVLKRAIKKKQHTILKTVEKKAKLVVKNHYRNLWLAIGMAAFGIPLGVTFGSILDNMAFLGIGLPIGLGIGIAIGTMMDKKAEHEGKQLDFELS